MKRLELTKWLEIIAILAGILGFIFLLFILPSIGLDIIRVNPEYAYMYYPTMFYLIITAIPFYMVLFEAWKIFKEIEKDNSFSLINAKSLFKISRISLVEVLLFFISAILLITQDLLHPSILILIILIMFIAFAVSICSAVLSHLVEKAITIQQENDLTI